VKPALRKKVAGDLQERYRISQRRACRVLRMPRRTLQYRPKSDPEVAALRIAINDAAAKRPRFGRRRSVAVRPPRIGATKPNEIWSIDFMHDRLTDGRKIRLLTIVDIFTRECVALHVAPAFKAADVVEVLRRVTSKRGMPQQIRCDNGTEFTAEAFDQWAYWNRVTIDFSRPGKPTDNAFIESFNGKVRQELLNPSWFATLEEGRRAAVAWRRDYNQAARIDRWATERRKSTPW